MLSISSYEECQLPHIIDITFFRRFIKPTDADNNNDGCDDYDNDDNDDDDDDDDGTHLVSHGSISSKALNCFLRAKMDSLT